MGYWINFDPARNTLHRGDCEHVQRWAREPKWRRFHTKEEACQAANWAIWECGVCLP